MKPDKEEIQKMMDQVKEIGGISLDIIYSSEKTNDKAKLINKKASLETRLNFAVKGYHFNRTIFLVCLNSPASTV